MEKGFSYGDAYQELSRALHSVYETSEAQAIAHLYLEHLTGKGRLQRLTEKDTRLTDDQHSKFLAANKRLVEGEPLQYVTGEQWFYGRKFFVDAGVLIPRPETEELISWVLATVENEKAVSVLDIGTGSGCIAVTLNLERKSLQLTAIDLSDAALMVAGKNATALGAEVQFLQTDFLDVHQQEALGNYDVIVSNPPYIPISERESLHRNVADFEPAMALFVENDPLLFYEAIARFALTHLHEGGQIFCELHQDYARQTITLFRSHGYDDVTLRQDMHGNERMLRARL